MEGVLVPSKSKKNFDSFLAFCKKNIVKMHKNGTDGKINQRILLKMQENVDKESKPIIEYRQWYKRRIKQGFFRIDNIMIKG